MDLAVHISGSSMNAASSPDVRPGTAYLDKRQKPPRIIVFCANNTSISVGRLKSQAKKEVEAGDWWNGLPKELRGKREILLGDDLVL
jgi:hypothetical protein